MKTNRKFQTISIMALVIAVLGLALGFAAFSTALQLSSSANVNPDASTFSVKFSTNIDKLTEAAVEPSDISSGITATNGVINNSNTPTLSNLSVDFTEPGQYAEYIVYIRNEGEYTAYLNSINFNEKVCTPQEETTESLVDAACDAINMSLIMNDMEYTASTGVTNRTLAKNTGEELKVRITYNENGARADGPFNVTFGSVKLIYSTIDAQE